MIFAILLASHSYAQISKHLVYKYVGDDYEKDGKWFFTSNSTGRFMVLGCGNFLLSKNTSVNICKANLSSLLVYDTYEKVLKTFDLEAHFGKTPKSFAYAFDQNSHMYLAELHVTDFYENDIAELVDPKAKQKMIKLNLSTLAIEASTITDEGKICTQLAFYGVKLICSQNVISKNDNQISIDLNIVSYDPNLSQVLKIAPVSKNKNYPMMPALNEMEVIFNRSSHQNKLLVFAEDLGGGLHSSGDSFSIDQNTADVLSIPELDTNKRISGFKFLGNYKMDSDSSLYLVTYYPNLGNPNKPPINYPAQFLVINKYNVMLMDVPASWGQFDDVIGVSSETSGQPVVYRTSMRSYEENDEKQLSIKSYSIFSGAESKIAQLDFDDHYNNRKVVWDSYSSSFYLLNWIEHGSENSKEIVDSEIQQVSLDGKIIHSTVIPSIAGELFLSPRSINPVVLGYSETQRALYDSVFTFSPIKRKATLIDQAPFALPMGEYTVPIFLNDSGLAMVMGEENSDEYSIYYYEYR